MMRSALVPDPDASVLELGVGEDILLRQDDFARLSGRVLRGDPEEVLAAVSGRLPG